MIIAADTWLVVHLFNETHLTSKAQKILSKDPLWVLPTLWREEYANVISKLARKEKHFINEVIQHFNDTLEQFKLVKFMWILKKHYTFIKIYSAYMMFILLL